MYADGVLLTMCFCCGLVLLVVGGCLFRLWGLCIWILLCQSFFGFGSTYEVDFELEGAEERKHLVLTKDSKTNRIPLFVGPEDVVGTVTLRAGKKKKLDITHAGIKVQLIGQIGEEERLSPPDTNAREHYGELTSPPGLFLPCLCGLCGLSVPCSVGRDVL